MIDIENKLINLPDAERTRLYTWRGTQGVTPSDACFVEVVKLDDDTYAFRHNLPNLDTEWEIGRVDDVADAWQEWRNDLLQANLEEIANN